MNKQYTLIFILPFCVEMIIIQIDNNKYEIYDRLIKTIDLSDDAKKGILSRKSIFKILNIIYGYRNIIKENRLEEDIIFVTDGVDQLENIDSLYGGINKIFNNSNEIIKNINKSHLIFLFFIDILKREKASKNKIIRLEHDYIEEYRFKNAKLIDYKKQKLYESRFDDILMNRDNDLKSIINGIKNIIRMKDIQITSDIKNNIFVLNVKQNKSIKKIFKNNIIDKDTLQKVLKKVGSLKLYEIKSKFNLTDLEVRQIAKIITIIEKIINDGNKVSIKEFNTSWYFTRTFIMKKMKIDLEEYYKFMYCKFIISNDLNREYIEYIEKMFEEILLKKKHSKEEFMRKFVLMKIAVVALIEDIDEDKIEELDLIREDFDEIKMKINQLKIERVLIQKEKDSFGENNYEKNIEQLFCIIYFLSILIKNGVRINTKVLENHFKFKINKKDISIFEKEIFNILKEYICDYEDEDIKISFNLGG